MKRFLATVSFLTFAASGAMATNSTVGAYIAQVANSTDAQIAASISNLGSAAEFNAAANLEAYTTAMKNNLDKTLTIYAAAKENNDSTSGGQTTQVMMDQFNAYYNRVKDIPAGARGSTATGANNPIIAGISPIASVDQVTPQSITQSLALMRARRLVYTFAGGTAGAAVGANDANVPVGGKTDHITPTNVGAGPTNKGSKTLIAEALNSQGAKAADGTTALAYDQTTDNEVLAVALANNPIAMDMVLSQISFRLMEETA